MLRYIEEVGHVLSQNHVFILVITQTHTENYCPHNLCPHVHFAC